MKLKTIIYALIIFIAVFLIYLTTLDKKIYYLNLSIDSETYTYDTLIKRYIDGFLSSTDRVTDLTNYINENKKITINDHEQTIKNALIKADLVTVFIGLNDINYKIGYSSMNELYDYADSFLTDIYDLLEILREYCKEDIIIMGYYNIYGSYYDEYFKYINKCVEEYAKELDMKYVSTNDIYDENSSRDNIMLTNSEHKILYEKVNKIIIDNVLND